MKLEQSFGLGLATVAILGSVAWNKGELDPSLKPSQDNLLLQEITRDVHLPPTLLVTATGTPRRLNTITPRSPRLTPEPTRITVATATKVPIPERVPLPTTTTIPDFEYPKYTPGPLGSKLNEPGTQIIEPWQVGVITGSTVFLSGIGLCTIVKSFCRVLHHRH